MVRGILCCLLFACIGRGESLDEAVRNLARKIAVRLAPADAPRVTARNLSSLSNGDVAKARVALERALRRTPARPSQLVDVALTLSQNQRGYLLVAELQRNGDRTIDMVTYRPDPVTHPARALIEKRLLWEQDNPMLDVIVVDDKMLVLEPAGITVYARRASAWERTDSKPLDASPVVRDPRGRLQITVQSVTAFLQGYVCRGTWMPALEVHCEAGDTPFPIGGEQVKLSPARNTLEASGWPPFCAYARTDEPSGPVYLLSELDGRAHVYDADKKPVWTFSSWGSDFVSPESGCGAGRQVIATAAADRDAVDSLTAYEIVDRKPVQASDPSEFPGPITALWPADSGAVAIARNITTGRYAAYSITIDCSH